MAAALLLILALVWGTSYGVSKLALGWMPVAGLLVCRFALTSTLLLVPQWQGWRAAPRDCTRRALPMGGLLALILLCETQGVMATRAANAAVLISLSVVLTPMLEWGLFGRRPTWALGCAATVCCVGTVLLAGGDALRWSWSWGETLLLLAAGMRALYVCLGPRYLGQSPLSSLALTGVQSSVVALLCLPLWWQQGMAVPAAPAFWLALAYLVGACTLLAFWIQTWAVRRCAPSQVALLTGSEPAFGVLFAVLVLDESLEALAGAGMALIVLATLWAGYVGARPPRLAREAAAG